MAIAGNLAGWQTLPYTFAPSPGPTLSAAKHAGSPGTVLAELGRFFESRPELALQVVLFAVFSLPIYSWIGRTPGTRLWGMSAYLVLVLLAFVLGPILLVRGARAHGAAASDVCAVRYNHFFAEFSHSICTWRVPLGGSADGVAAEK